MRLRHIPLGIALAILGLSGAISCQKDYTGQEIRIRANARSDSPSTKTSYSGVEYTESSTTYERIDWEEGDLIMLAMTNDDVTNSQQAYEITGVSASDRYSVAGLVPYGTDSGLLWGSGTHDFWSAYPSTATVGDHTVSGNVPATQTLTYSTTSSGVLYYTPDMNYAYMVAGLQTTDQSSGISLDYYPAVTTFDFTVGANDDIVVTGFEMETSSSGETSDVAMSGDFTATFDSNMAYSFGSANTGQSLTASFSADASISTSTSMNFKLFALPQDITGVRIKFTLSDGTTRSLNFKQNDAWITFPACIKANITGLLVPGAVWYITFSGPRIEQWVTNSDIEIGVE